jgi:Flp pilus assembly protein TadD
MRQATLQEKLGNYHQATEHYYRQVLQLDPNSGVANNSLAWILATSPELSLRDACEAVRLGKKAVAAEPQSGACWNTLGVAHYRDGDCKAAVETLEKSMMLRSGGDAYDWFFLAMAHWHLGDRDKARLSRTSFRPPVGVGFGPREVLYCHRKTRMSRWDQHRDPIAGQQVSE